MNHSEFDLIVLGGGLVGLTLANLCANHGLSVAVVEMQKPILEWPVVSSDLRCSAISRSSQKIFENLDIWEGIIANRASPYHRMVVWDANGFGEIAFDAAEVAEPDLGHIIENRVMIKALWEKAEKDPNIKLKVSAKPVDLIQESNQIILELNDAIPQASSEPLQLHAKLLVGADGARSWVREISKIAADRQDYKQSALIATVKTEMPHQKTAWQRFLPEGPLAFLPLLEPHTASIVWTSTETHIKELLALPHAQFCQELAHAFDYRLGKILSSSECLSFPLAMLNAKEYVKERIALVGDAAHVIHPLAGQGVNLGMSDAAQLSEVLFNAKKNDFDIGNYLVLRKYERARRGHVSTMIQAMTFFNHLYGSELSLVSNARSLGLNFVDKFKFLKKKIILKAMGVSQ